VRRENLQGCAGQRRTLYGDCGPSRHRSFMMLSRLQLSSSATPASPKLLEASSLVRLAGWHLQLQEASTPYGVYPVFMYSYPCCWCCWCWGSSWCLLVLGHHVSVRILARIRACQWTRAEVWQVVVVCVLYCGSYSSMGVLKSARVYPSLEMWKVVPYPHRCKKSLRHNSETCGRESCRV
jgi:hypothetical protein